MAGAAPLLRSRAWISSNPPTEAMRPPETPSDWASWRMRAARSDGALVAPVTQQALADAVGTTRETVARALGELRLSGSIATVRGGILLRDPEQLAAEAERASGV